MALAAFCRFVLTLVGLPVRIFIMYLVDAGIRNGYLISS